MSNRRLDDNPEKWDLGILSSVFHAQADNVFKHDFGGELKYVIPLMMQIKDMRNRRVHHVSTTLPIQAKEAYRVADCACQFYERLTIPVPESFIGDFRSLRRHALQLLYVEELHEE